MPTTTRLFGTMTALVAIIVATAGLAVAKGPESATITGPGLDEPLELVDWSNRDAMSALMEQTGIWFDTGRALEEPPDTLGPAYVIAWVNSGPPGLPVAERTIVQEVYLAADGGPVLHTPTQASTENWGQRVLGWRTAPPELSDTLASLGVPVDALDTAGPARSLLWSGLGAAALIVIVAKLALLRRRRAATAPAVPVT